jgi:hypothetical protein
MRVVTASVLAAIGLLSACTSPVETSVGYPAERRAVPPELRAPAGCRLDVTEIADRRPDPSVMGRMAGRVVKAPGDPQAWIRNVVGSLNAYGIEVQFTAAPPLSELRASVALRTAWVSSIATAKTGNVVLSVRYERGGGLVKEAAYRGSESDVNWNNSSGEIQGMVDATLDQIVDAMSRDVRDLCTQAIGH